MYFRTNEDALKGLYEISRQDCNKAMNYAAAGSIRSTVSKSTMLEIISEASATIQQIKAICDAKSLAMLEYFYGYEDKFNNPLCQINLAEQFFPENLKLGICIVQNWRDGGRLDELMAGWFQMATSTARLKVTQGKDALNQHKLHFYHPDYALATGIEEILIAKRLKPAEFRGC